MDDYRSFAVSLVREAGLLLKRKLNDSHTIRYKGEIDLVTEADILSEQLIVAGISKRFPGHDILSEETPDAGRRSAFRWIIDPLDGTTNYAHGYPVFCVSLALEIEGDIRLGVIYNPMLNELFVAEKGRGAFLGRRRLKVSETGDIGRSLLATGFPYNIRTVKKNNLDYFSALAVCAQAVRRAGSAAFDMACVAAGRFDGFWELGLKPWDTAAAWLMITEAGGVVSELDGDSFSLLSPHVLCSNGIIHREMIKIIGKCDEERTGGTGH